jgi:hypothetical protein
MSTPKIIKKDPTQHCVTGLLFLLLRFAMVFAVHAIIVIEWQVYIIKIPFPGIIGLMGYPCCFWLCLLAIVDQRRKESLLVKCILAFQ